MKELRNVAGDQEDIIQMENHNWRKPAGDLIMNDSRKENENDLRIECSNFDSVYSK